MKKTTVLMAAALVAAALCAAGARAEVKGGDAKAGAASSNVACKSMDMVLSIYEGDIVPAAEAMPADKFDFAPSTSTFAADSKADFTNPKPVMTFAAEVRHIAEANYMFFTMGGAKPDRDVKAIEDLKSRDEILKALKDSYAFGHKVLNETSDADALKEIKIFGKPSTPAAAYAFAMAHMGDHYGQMVEYLRMNGVVPPASRPKAKNSD
jgi:uncharacterized damage-inducible protein DinB